MRRAWKSFWSSDWPMAIILAFFLLQLWDDYKWWLFLILPIMMGVAFALIRLLIFVWDRMYGRKHGNHT